MALRAVEFRVLRPLLHLFGEAGRHARVAVASPVLPLDTPVEVEVVFTYI